MLTHASAAAALTHDALCHASCVRGVVDLRGLIASHLAHGRAMGIDVAAPAAWGFALALCPAALFAAHEVFLGPAAPVAEEAPATGEQSEGLPQAARAGSTLRLASTLPEALAIIDALVALGAARLDASREPQMAAHTDLLSARERAVLQAAWHGPPWPQVRLSPALEPAAALARGRAQGRALRQVLAREQLLTRPLALWLGPRAPISLLSPFVREVEGALLQAAPERLLALGVPGPWPAGPDLGYALGDALARAVPEVRRERASQEATAGIRTFRLQGTEVEVVDAGALSPATWDARLSLPQAPPWQSAERAPVIVRCPLGSEPWPGGRGLDPSGPLSTLQAAGLVLGLGEVEAVSVVVCEPTAAGPLRSDTLPVAASLHPMGGACLCPLALTTPNAWSRDKDGSAPFVGEPAAFAVRFDGHLLAEALAALSPTEVCWVRAAQGSNSQWPWGMALAQAWLQALLSRA